MVVSEALSLWNKNEGLIILGFILGLERIDILLDLNRQLKEDEKEEFLSIIKKRKEGYPLQYILGKWSFYDFDVYVRPGVLIPRPETELLVDEALKSIEENARVLEIGTGTGVISIALAIHKKARVTATDISQEAIDLAKKNASYNGVKIDFIQSDLYENVGDKYDLIISNPPYISEEERSLLDKELSYEPEEALFSGEDGLDLIGGLIKDAPDYLNEGGLVLIEIGYNQGEKVKSLFKEHGFKDILIRKDYNNYDRIGKGYLC